MEEMRGPLSCLMTFLLVCKFIDRVRTTVHIYHALVFLCMYAPMDLHNDMSWTCFFIIHYILTNLNEPAIKKIHVTLCLKKNNTRPLYTIYIGSKKNEIIRVRPFTTTYYILSK